MRCKIHYRPGDLAQSVWNKNKKGFTALLLEAVNIPIRSPSKSPAVTKERPLLRHSAPAETLRPC